MSSVVLAESSTRLRATVTSSVPDALVSLVTTKANNRFYVRRGTDNIVFGFDPKLSVRG